MPGVRDVRGIVFVAELGRSRSRAPGDVVEPAMIMAFELDDGRPARRRAQAEYRLYDLDPDELKRTRSAHG